MIAIAGRGPIRHREIKEKKRRVIILNEVFVEDACSAGDLPLACDVPGQLTEHRLFEEAGWSHICLAAAQWIRCNKCSATGLRLDSTPGLINVPELGSVLMLQEDPSDVVEQMMTIGDDAKLLRK